jgi:hypothetical protein
MLGFGDDVTTGTIDARIGTHSTDGLQSNSPGRDRISYRAMIHVYGALCALLRAAFITIYKRAEPACMNNYISEKEIRI